MPVLDILVNPSMHALHKKRYRRCPSKCCLVFNGIKVQKGTIGTDKGGCKVKLCNLAVHACRVKLCTQVSANASTVQQSHHDGFGTRLLAKSRTPSARNRNFAHLSSSTSMQMRYGTTKTKTPGRRTQCRYGIDGRVRGCASACG